MKQRIKDGLKRLFGQAADPAAAERAETALLALGALLSKQQWQMDSQNLHDYEFRIFSQFGDDGIIQYLIKHVPLKNRTFIEFGVEDYLESNTRFLLMNDNWSGFVMDGSQEAMESLRNQSWFWRYDLTCRAAFIDRENINGLLASTGFTDIGLLHIDLDGNDYHILHALDMSRLNPAILILEYNSVFGKERAVTVPYDPSFVRTRAHYSNLYFGASLPALAQEANRRGYGLVGCNLAGNNAYFVRRDLLGGKLTERSVQDAYVESRYRESRHQDYRLSLLSGADRLALIRGLEVENVLTGQLERL